MRNKFLIGLSVVLLITLPIGNILHATAAAGEIASYELGEYDAQGQDVWTQDAVNNNQGTVNALGLNNPSDVVMDSLNHRLYVADNNNERILVYQLDATNHVLSITPTYVIGQSNPNSNSGGLSASNFFLAPYATLAIDSARGYLFVSDSANNRVLVFNTNNLATGMSASFAIGQANLTTKAIPSIGQNTLNQPAGLAFDPTNNMLYVADSRYDRVMVFNTSSMSDGMPASNVVGQPNYYTDNHGVANDQTIWFPLAVALDNGHRLFVADNGNCRVLTFNITNISSNPIATSELGETDMNSSCTNSDNTSAINDPEGLTYDSSNQRLFVSDQADGRVLVYDMSNPSDAEAPSAEIGQPDFSTIASEPAMQSTVEGPGGSWYDVATHQLIVSDLFGDRILIYNMLQLNQSTLPSGSVAKTYSALLSANYTQGTTTYSVVAGSLPSGLTLGSDGSIFGTPNSSGLYNFTVKAFNNWGSMGVISDLAQYSIQIDTAPSSPNQQVTSSANTGSSFTTPTSTYTPTTLPPSVPPYSFLNSYPEFTNGVGVYQSLAPGQSINFLMSTTATPNTNDVSSFPNSSSYQQHTITVNAIGSNYVNLTVASIPVHVHLTVGHTANVDVNHNNHPAISIYLVNIKNGSADLIIKSLLPTATSVMSSYQNPNKVTQTKSAKNISLLPILIFLGTAAAILYILRLRKHHTKKTT